MTRRLGWIGLLPLALLAACSPVSVTERGQEAAAPLSAPELWTRHMARDLVPFWTQPPALGARAGEFLTFRCHDGRAWDAAAPCPELEQAPDWMREALGRDYTRMRSRQTYFYGAAFHLLGDQRLLELARAGAERIAAEVDGAGSIPSWREAGEPAPAPDERTSQDLAYAQLGLAMYWYLTRDAATLEALVRVERHLFERYWRDDWGMLAWTLAGAESERQELVAQLDQVNAYLLLLAPLLPEPHRERWTEHLRRLARILVDRYWSEELGVFWGRLDDPAELRFGGRHLDFGHTAKALWMLERIAAATGDRELGDWVRPRAARLLERAFVAESGCWSSAPREDGSVDRALTWWIVAELDQATATLALADRAQARYLPATAACWFGRLVDAEQGGVWAWADPVDPARHFGKVHFWKNGYHEGEHALVMAIAAAALAGRPTRLHFALPEGTGEEALRPYFFAGRVTARRDLGRASSLPGHVVEEVAFADIR